METLSKKRQDSLLRDLQIAVVAVAVIASAAYVILGVLAGGRLRASMTVLLSFAPSGVLGLVALLAEMRRRPFSLHLMHLLAVIVLLVFSPMMQLISGNFPGGLRSPDEEVLRGNWLVFLWLTAYVAGEAVLRQRKSAVRRPIPLMESNMSLLSLWVGTLAAAACLSYLAYRGTVGVTTRAAFGAAYRASTTVESGLLILVRGLPMIVFAAWVMSIILMPKRRTWPTIFLVAILFGANVLVNNPLAAARIWTLTMFLALVCVTYLRRRTTAVLLMPGAALGLALMPLLNVGRTRSEFSLQMPHAPVLTQNSSMFDSGDFDAFVNLLLTHRLVDAEGISYGRQFVGAAFFWVPRRFWADKPVGSGTYLADRLQLPWENISSPLPAEALINFGVWGVAPAALAFSCLLYVVDSRYYLNRDGAPPDTFRVLDVVYPFWLGLTIFATRGDLINTFSFVGGISAAGVLSLRLFNTARNPPLPAASATRQ